MQQNLDSMQPVSASGDLEWQRMRSDSLQPLSYSHSVCSKESTSAQQPLSLTRAAGIALGTTHSPPAATSCDVSNSPPSFRERVPASRDSERSKVQSHGLRRFCRDWFTAYHILALCTLIANAVTLGLLISLRLPLTGILNAVSANLLVSILVRQEDLINATFSLVAKIPSSLPLAVRSTIADFHHYGGVHIGCAVASLLWYCLFVAINTQACIRSVKDRSMTTWHWIDITTCYAFLSFIVMICLMAIPFFREKLHNTFERTHRFGGWAALAVLWVNSGIHTKVDTRSPLYLSPSIWLLSMATFFIILPWTRIRRIPIRAQAVSSREVKLTFPYANMPYTSTSRFSLAPVTEWHAFATIPSHDGLTADIIISAAGGWTKRVIANPPEWMWIRKPAAKNFLTFTPIFNSVLLVATGAGIGPMLSLLSSPTIEKMKAQGKNIRVMWCVHDPDAAHWAFVQTAIRNVDPIPMIFDSRKRRPDIPFEARHLAQIDDLEAVMIVSNKKVTNDVIAEVKAHGRAAYGAVFDS